MARPTWTNIVDGDVDLDSELDEDLFEALRDNAAAARISVLGIDVDEDTTTTDSPSWDQVLAGDFDLEIPDLNDYVGIARKVTVTVEAKVTSGTTGNLRIYNVTNATGGSAVGVTETSYTDKEVEINVDSWKGTKPLFRLEFQRTGGSGSVYCQAPKAMTVRLEY